MDSAFLTQLKKYLNQIEPILDAKKHDWNLRVEAMEKLVELFENQRLNTSTSQKAVELLKQLHTPLTKQLLDIRSSVVKAACHTISSLAIATGRKFQPFLDIVLPDVLSLNAVSINVMSSSGRECMYKCIKYSRFNTEFLCKTILNNRNGQLRASSTDFIAYLLETWSKTYLTSSYDRLVKAITHALTDSNPLCRQAARKSMYQMGLIWPEKVRDWQFVDLRVRRVFVHDYPDSILTEYFQHPDKYSEILLNYSMSETPEEERQSEDLKSIQSKSPEKNQMEREEKEKDLTNVMNEEPSRSLHVPHEVERIQKEMVEKEQSGNAGPSLVQSTCSTNSMVSSSSSVSSQTPSHGNNNDIDQQTTKIPLFYNGKSPRKHFSLSKSKLKPPNNNNNQKEPLLSQEMDNGSETKTRMHKLLEWKVQQQAITPILSPSSSLSRKQQQQLQQRQQTMQSPTYRTLLPQFSKTYQVKQTKDTMEMDSTGSTSSSMEIEHPKGKGNGKSPSEKAPCAPQSMEWEVKFSPSTKDNQEAARNYLKHEKKNLSKHFKTSPKELEIPETPTPCKQKTSLIPPPTDEKIRNLTRAFEYVCIEDFDEDFKCTDNQMNENKKDTACQSNVPKNGSASSSDIDRDWNMVEYGSVSTPLGDSMLSTDSMASSMMSSRVSSLSSSYHPDKSTPFSESMIETLERETSEQKERAERNARQCREEFYKTQRQYQNRPKKQWWSKNLKGIFLCLGFFMICHWIWSNIEETPSLNMDKGIFNKEIKNLVREDISKDEIEFQESPDELDQKTMRKRDSIKEELEDRKDSKEINKGTEETMKQGTIKKEINEKVSMEVSTQDEEIKEETKEKEVMKEKISEELSTEDMKEEIVEETKEKEVVNNEISMEEIVKETKETKEKEVVNNEISMEEIEEEKKEPKENEVVNNEISMEEIIEETKEKEVVNNEISMEEIEEEKKEPKEKEVVNENFTKEQPITSEKKEEETKQGINQEMNEVSEEKEVENRKKFDEINPQKDERLKEIMIREPVTDHSISVTDQQKDSNEDDENEMERNPHPSDLEGIFLCRTKNESISTFSNDEKLESKENAHENESIALEEKANEDFEENQKLKEDVGKEKKILLNDKTTKLDTKESNFVTNVPNVTNSITSSSSVEQIPSSVTDEAQTSKEMNEPNALTFLKLFLLGGFCGFLFLRKCFARNASSEGFWDVETVQPPPPSSSWRTIEESHRLRQKGIEKAVLISPQSNQMAKSPIGFLGWISPPQFQFQSPMSEKSTIATPEADSMSHVETMGSYSTFEPTPGRNEFMTPVRRSCRIRRKMYEQTSQQ